MPHLSVVIPVYKGEGCLQELYRRLKTALEGISHDFEIILVDDFGSDATWRIISELAQIDRRVMGIQLSRNFGQHAAITAGLTYAKGDFVVVMDCDLQENPTYIADLYQKAQEGYDIVYAKKVARRYSRFHNITSMTFYRFFAFISDYEMDPNIGSFSIVSRKVVDAFLQFNDYKRAYLMVLKWLGFKSAVVEVEHQERYDGGRSSYSFLKRINHALTMIVSYSDKPLRLSIYLGSTFSLLSFLGILYLVYRYIFFHVQPGWTSTMVATIFMGGLIMSFLGIKGLYISRIFEQVKHRPIFLVQETINFRGDGEIVRLNVVQEDPVLSATRSLKRVPYAGSITGSVE